MKLFFNFEGLNHLPLSKGYNRPNKFDLSPITVALAQELAEEEQELQQSNTYYIDSHETESGDDQEM